MPSSDWIATAIPPFAVPSIFVKMIPLISATSINCFAWESAFWPVVPSRTRSVSLYASGYSLSMIRLIFFSSSIRFFLLWRRPAVSQIKTSVFLAFAAWTASKITAAGSEPSLWEITPTFARFPHSSSWSIAAARKVSAAAKSTLFPSAFNWSANLPIDVVFPTPLTPMTSTTGFLCSNS